MTRIQLTVITVGGKHGEEYGFAEGPGGRAVYFHVGYRDKDDTSPFPKADEVILAEVEYDEVGQNARRWRRV